MKKDKRASTVAPFIPEEEIGTDEWTDEGLRSQAIENLATRVARLEGKTEDCLGGGRQMIPLPRYPAIPEEDTGPDLWPDESLLRDLITQVAILERKTDAMWEVTKHQTLMINILAEYLGFPTGGEEDGRSPGD